MLVAGGHLLGEPVHLPTGFEVRLLLVQQFHVPLLGDAELDVLLTALVHLDGVFDGLATQQHAVVVQVLGDGVAGLVGGHASVLAGEVGERARLVDRHPQVEVVGLVPLDVGLVAEGAAHDHPRASVGVDAFVGDDGHFLAEQRHASGTVDEMGAGLVLGVDDHRHAGG